MLEEGWPRKGRGRSIRAHKRIVGKWLARYRQTALAGLRNRSQEIAERLHLPRSMVAGHLTLGGWRRSSQSEPARRYDRARAGELVHLDTKKLAR